MSIYGGSPEDRHFERMLDEHTDGDAEFEWFQENVTEQEIHAFLVEMDVDRLWNFLSLHNIINPVVEAMWNDKQE